MRTLIVTAFVSLDGVMEAPGGEPGYRNSGWTFKDIEHVDESYEIKGREQEEATAMMMGRVSYEAFSPVWPDMDYFAGYNAMPKYVVSTTLQRPISSRTGARPHPALPRRRRRAQGDRRRADHHPRQRLTRRQPVRRRPDRPLPPARLPAAARRGQAAVQQTDKDKQMLTWWRASPTPTACRSRSSTSSGSPEELPGLHCAQRGCGLAPAEDVRRR